MEQTAIDKALDVLFHVGAQSQPCGVSEIGRALSLPKSSTHRLVSTLARRGLVERDEQGRYRLGVALFALAQGFMDQDPVVGAGRPVLEALAAELGETCFFVAARKGRLVVLDKVEGNGLLRASPRVGAEVPVRGTAAGKLYTAHAPRLVEGGPDSEVPFTAATLDQPAFAAAVAQSRAEGYAQNDGEWIEGLSVVGVPVFAHDKLTCVLSVAAPSGHMTTPTRRAIVEHTKQAAARVGARLEGKTELAR